MTKEMSPLSPDGHVRDGLVKPQGHTRNALGSGDLLIAEYDRFANCGANAYFEASSSAQPQSCLVSNSASPLD
jgi:hypothetical protein